MHIPKHFEQAQTDAMQALMRAHPFATLVTHTRDGLCGNHLPLELRPAPGPYGTLAGHVARANPIWRSSLETEALVIFQGPNAYISPSWYPSKAETERVVPTWNYAVVHAQGPLRVINDPQWLRAHLESLTNQQEATFSLPWRLSDAPSAFIDQLLTGIVGIEIPITRLSGKWKLSQNRSDRDRAGVVSGLRRLGDSPMADWVERGAD